MDRSAAANASVVDIFCGAGGLSHGFFLEGFRVAAGVDMDDQCRYPYETNNKAKFVRRDVTQITGEELNSLFSPGSTRVLVGCAPCQPFSVYNQKNTDPKWKLLTRFGSLIEQIAPDVVSMENVPRLKNFRNGAVLREFVDTLETAGYNVVYDVLYGPDYGLPQTRSRLVLLASKLGPIKLPQPSHKSNYVTVRDAIESLSPLRAGGIDPEDPLHRASALSELNLQRIRTAKPGGTWRDWDSELRVPCHKAPSGRGYSSVYGRMEWDAPSPTITTQFFGFGNGRFGHPVQDRALSLREGAILQSFPKDYHFIASEHEINTKAIGRMIGNAVPVILGQAIARRVADHLVSMT
jgi:DNA (cytosine-5)-methyltransferase 1